MQNTFRCDADYLKVILLIWIGVALILALLLFILSWIAALFLFVVGSAWALVRFWIRSSFRFTIKDSDTLITEMKYSGTGTSMVSASNIRGVATHEGPIEASVGVATIELRVEDDDGDTYSIYWPHLREHARIANRIRSISTLKVGH